MFNKCIIHWKTHPNQAYSITISSIITRPAPIDELQA